MDTNTSLAQLDLNFRSREAENAKELFSCQVNTRSLPRQRINGTGALAHLRFHGALIRVC